MMPGPFLLTSIHPSLPLQMFFIVTNNIHLHLYIFLYIFRSNTCRYMPRLKRRYVSPDVLVIDDFANTRISEDDALQIFKVMEYRYGFKTTIIASQLEPAEWHKNFGASQLADSILDRIVSNAYKIILSGDSLRPKQLED